MAQTASFGQPYRVISLFSGLGGLDLGFGGGPVVVRRESVDPSLGATPYKGRGGDRPEWGTMGFVQLPVLPFQIVLQNDILAVAQELAALNGWTHNYHLRDIGALLEDTEFSWPPAEVVIGGFPCQDFSHAGKRQGFQAERGNLYQAFVAVVERVRPLVFVAENVHGLLTMPGNPLEVITNDFAARGYQVRHQLVRCEEYGIPQTRWRVIIMGVRSDKSTGLTGAWNELGEVHRRHCSLRPYFAHLAEPQASNDPAQKAYSQAKRLAKGQGQKAVDLDGWGPTMRAEHHGNIEFRRLAEQTVSGAEAGLPERRLSVREAALIQTFPPDCLLTRDNKVSMIAYKPIGNAVPPLLGYLLAHKVQSLLTKMLS